MKRDLLYKKAKKFIPGISQLFGKRPDLYLPGNKWPIYYSKAKGVEIWSLDKKKYYDFTMVGIGTAVLGYSDRDITRTAKNVIDNGSMTTLNPPEDVELAEMLLKIHPWADKVRYARTGGESMSVAIRLARAYTKKEKILFCGYHGWFDWYLAANLKTNKNLDKHLLSGLNPRGVPKSLTNSVIPFQFNNERDLEKVVKKNAKNCAAIVMEPCRDFYPAKGFLQEIRKIATKNKCILIFDEITCGWRMDASGVHMGFNVNPDIAVFGKTIANGVPMGAIIGKKKVMNLATKTFISSAFWTERLGPACALTFIKKHKKINLGTKLIKTGKKIKKIWKDAANNSNLNINIKGIDPLANFNLEVKDWPVALTFFIQEMLKKNFLASEKCYANYRHNDELLKKYEKACFEVFEKISKYNKLNNLKYKLEGPVKQMNFERLNDKY